ncbi:MAG TPA: Crp/Fnr family transcriptional regulator [Burkholderiaceae bacterium]|nr:Crp/Fnr family transcriptional regulator [Burkholderiaceae bacterium]
MPLDIGAAMYTAGEPTRHVYFPIDGFISLVSITGDGPGLEVGMVGSEGMLGAQLALGVSTIPLRAMVQGQGSALRVDAAPFRRRLTTSKALQSELNRYLYVLMAQLATSAACTRFHSVGPRLARWLLMSHDRAHADTFRLTHEFLAFMLGVRRVGITRAASELQQRGLVRYQRGVIHVLDRPGLEGAACSCYAADRSAYGRMFDSH